MSLLMKALKRAETAHAPTQHDHRAAPLMPGTARSGSSHALRDERMRSTALWSVAALLVLGAALYGYTLWREPEPLVLSPAPAAIATPAASVISEPPSAAARPEAAMEVEAQTPTQLKPESQAKAPAAAVTATPSTALRFPIAPRNVVPDTNPQIAIHQNSDASPGTVQRAYLALRAGQTNQARALYLEALAEDAGVDALLGLAAIAANSGDSRQAAAYYREALLREPSNSAALAGIALLASSGDPQAAQKPLERMAEKTDSASVRAALGNVYAGQAKWQAAQQAYFEAFRKEPENANHAYNLAVSLDQLGERTLALEYYRKALSLGARGGAVYDAVSIERRIADLRDPS